MEFLTRIEENSERLSALVNDILDLAKIESPNMYLECERFDPAAVVDEIQKDFGHSLEQRKQSLVIRSNVKELYADRRLFEQALRNLIENSHRYCPDGSKIEIQSTTTTEQGRNYVKFMVFDNGPGISPEDLPRIFERFYRADKSRNRLSGGTGLGLAIVKHIMLSHGGFVRATSEPLRGASFSMYFPSEPSQIS
jgi:signal transduction histidine kinase